MEMKKRKKKIERDIALSKILSRKFIDQIRGRGIKKKKKKKKRYDLRSR